MRNKSLLAFLFCVLPGSLLANGGTYVTPANIVHDIFIGLETGYSISTRTIFQPDYDVVTNAAWITEEHSIFNADFNTSSLFGAFIGFRVNENVSVDFSYDYRGNYHWDRISNLGTTATPTVGERYVLNGLRINTFLLDLNLNPTVDWGGLTPYVTVGVGVASNRVGSFQNFDIPSSLRGIPQTFNVLVDGRTVTNLAWKIGAGVDYCCPGLDALHFNLGYRFVDVGNVETGIGFADSFSGTVSTINPFKARHVQFNEVVIGAVYHFIG